MEHLGSTNKYIDQSTEIYQFIEFHHWSLRRHANTEITKCIGQIASLKSQRYINFQVIWKGDYEETSGTIWDTNQPQKNGSFNCPEPSTTLSFSCCLRFLLWESWHKAFKLRLHKTPRFTDWQSQFRNRTKKEKKQVIQTSRDLKRSLIVGGHDSPFTLW